MRIGMKLALLAICANSAVNASEQLGETQAPMDSTPIIELEPRPSAKEQAAPDDAQGVSTALSAGEASVTVHENAGFSRRGLSLREKRLFVLGLGAQERK